MLCVSFWNLEPNSHPGGVGLENVISAEEAGTFIENWRRKGWLACVRREIWGLTEPDRPYCSMADLCKALSVFGVAITVDDFVDEPRLNVLMNAPFAGAAEWMFLDCFYTVSAPQTCGLRGGSAPAVDAGSVEATLTAASFVLRRAP